MKFIQIGSKPINLNPKRLFRSKKNGLSSSSNDHSIGSSSSSSSSEAYTSKEKSHTRHGVVDLETPRSVLPGMSGDWCESSPDTPLDMVQAYKLSDRDQHEVVTRKELEGLLSQLGAEPLSEEEVTMMLSEIGGNGEGCISLDALLNRVGSACGPTGDSELRDAFDVFDTDHDGRITAGELLRFFSALGDDRCTLEDCRRMIAAVDKNGDGFVCFEDFSRMMALQR